MGNKRGRFAPSKGSLKGKPVLPFQFIVIPFTYHKMNSIGKFILVIGVLFSITVFGVADLATKRFILVYNSDSVKICYESNLPIESINNTVERVIVTIHGSGKTALNYYDYMYDAALREGELNNTLIVAPQFIEEEEVDSFSLGSDYVYWDGGWREGDNSISTVSNPRSHFISSYSVIDSMIFKIIKNYSKLKIIIVTGHSAGGQFINRYAAGNVIHDSLCASNIMVRYIVNNPSSYVYLDNYRPVIGTTDSFSVPNATNCSYYNNYKYGLNNLNDYMSLSNALEIIRQYRQRNVIYLLGANDTNPNASDLDISCAGMMQGNHRLERGNYYYEYLKFFYGEDIISTHYKAIVPGVAHSAYGMFNSDTGRNYIFALPTEITTPCKTLTISGYIITEQDSPIAGVTVALSGDTSLSFITGKNGKYSFDVLLDGNYTIIPSKINDSIPSSGVTTFDLVLIQSHIIYIQPFDSPYKRIAADVNGSSAVSTLDIVFGRSLVLNKITSFPNGRLWEFVNSDAIPDSLNPFPFDSTRTYTGLTETYFDQNFIGVKLGDVNNSWR